MSLREAAFRGSNIAARFSNQFDPRGCLFASLSKQSPPVVVGEAAPTMAVRTFFFGCLALIVI